LCVPARACAQANEPADLDSLRGHVCGERRSGPPLLVWLSIPLPARVTGALLLPAGAQPARTSLRSISLRPADEVARACDSLQALVQELRSIL
jgi:hypothetical protein